jgi:hypothetical protein
MSAAEHREMRQRNRERYGVEQPGFPVPPPAPDEKPGGRRDPDDVDMRATES